jgi:hypothetical protein
MTAIRLFHPGHIERDQLEVGEKAAWAAVHENAPRWASYMLTGCANYVSTLAIYAQHGGLRLDRPNPPARYQRYYLLDGSTRTGMA